jgi:hypothetical protein
LSNKGLRTMTHSKLVNAQLNAPLRSLALTVEEAKPGEFRWRILESQQSQQSSLTFVSVACSDMSFAAYDTALATGYGELQRFIGPDLQYGPRNESDRATDFITIAPLARPRTNTGQVSLDKRTANGSVNESSGLRP